VDAPREGRTRTPYGWARVSHVGLNDDVVEGLALEDEAGALLSFSVQYHPEAAAGPHDASYLFDRFTGLMAARRNRQDAGAQRPSRSSVSGAL
jgi:carbamoyl-phosphate synthase small subunit